MSVGQTITELRKQKGWSQEDLAYRLNVSRQSVSKWESEQSAPELEKIIKLSQLFGVSTDYILKGDDGGIMAGATSSIGLDGVGEGSSGMTGEIRNLSDEEVHDAVEVHKRAAKGIAAGVALCILSPICLIVLAGYIETSGTSEKILLAGVAILLVLVALGVGIIIPSGLKLSKYEFLEKENVGIDSRTKDFIRQSKESYSHSFTKGIAFGVVLCIIGVIPVIIGPMVSENPLIICLMVGILLLAVAVAVYVFIRVCIVNGVYEKLLQDGDYTIQKKVEKIQAGPFSAAYWCIITAVYLAISFIWCQWDKSWIIWLPAAGAFVAIKGIMATKVGSKNK